MTAMRRGWLHLATGAGIGRVLGFVSNLLLSRWLGPTELGLFNLVTTTVQTSDTLVRCGGDYALNFELGGESEPTRTECGAQLVRGLAQLCSLMTALICIGVGLWVWWGQGLFPISLAASQRWSLTILLVLMIACEGISSSAWEVLLVSNRTSQLALKQGLFLPLRLLLAATGSLLWGVLGAMAGWTLIALVQCLWLKKILRNNWNPFYLWPPMLQALRRLLIRGLPFYGANLLSSLVFYPLLLSVASGSGLSEIGYLRVGQILQQLFAFLPATLVPVLFLRLRTEKSFEVQTALLEKPLRIVWLLLVAALILYCFVDQLLVRLLFGQDFNEAVLPSRLLLLTSLLESLSQLLVQPFLAAGKIRYYAISQNLSVVLLAFAGWFFIPKGALDSYLFLRLAYVAIPFLILVIPLLRVIQDRAPLVILSVVTCALSIMLVAQAIGIAPLQFPIIPGLALLLIISISNKEIINDLSCSRFNP